MSESVDFDGEYPVDVAKEDLTIRELPENEESQRYLYIQETTQRVLNQSEANLQSYLGSERFMANLSVSLMDHYRMELLLKKFPNKRDKILPLMPQSGDRHFTLDPGSVVYQRQKERDSLIQSAPWELGEFEEFNEEVRHLAGTEAEDLLQRAKGEVDGLQQEGFVLVISLNIQDVMKVIQNGQYKASLDNPDLGYRTFSVQSREEIQKQATLTSDRPVNTIGFSPLGRRYLRELQMGTYPIGGDESGIPHPVYGQMIIDQDTGLLHTKEAGYGNLNLRLKTERIKDRTTFFTGDSVNDSWQGQQLGWDEAVKARAVLDKLEEDSKVDWRYITPYIEAQIMGGVLVQDIDGCDFESSEKTKELEDYFSANPEKFEVSKTDNGLIRVKFK